MILPAGSQQHFEWSCKGKQIFKASSFCLRTVYVGGEVWAAPACTASSHLLLAGCWTHPGLASREQDCFEATALGDMCKVMYSLDVFLSTCLVEQHLAEDTNGSILLSKDTWMIAHKRFSCLCPVHLGRAKLTS